MSMNKKLIGIFSGAILLLFFFILPAEYGYDPTGIGKSVGILNFSKNRKKYLKKTNYMILMMKVMRIG